MICGICNKSHSGMFIHTEKHGHVNIECLIELVEKVIEIGTKIIKREESK